MAMEMLELSAVSTSQLSYVTTVTPESFTADTSQQDDIQYEHVTTNVDYEHYHNHYTSLSNTDYLQYDSRQLTTSPTTSRQYMESSNNREVVDDSYQSVSAAASGQNRQSVTSQRQAESAPATDEDYLVVLPDDIRATTPQTTSTNILCETGSSYSAQQSSETTQRQSSSPNNANDTYEHMDIPGRGGWVVVSVVAVAFVVVLPIFIGLYYMGINDEFPRRKSELPGRKVTANFIRTMNINENFTKTIRSFSVLDGAMLLGGTDELFVYNVAEERLIYHADGWYYHNLIMSLLVGDNCLASLAQSGYVTVTSFNTYQDVAKAKAAVKPTYLSYSIGTIYVTDDLSETHYSTNFGHDWNYLAGSYSSTIIAAIKSSAVASSAFSATANGNLTAFWLVQSSTDRWSIYVYVLEETSKEMKYSLVWMSFLPSYHNTIRRNEVDLPDSLTLSLATQLVDDGRGNAFVVDRDYQYRNSTTDIHWFWMNDTYQGQYGGVLLTREKLGVFYSIAVNNGLLYVAHDGYISVFQLIYI